MRERRAVVRHAHETLAEALTASDQKRIVTATASTDAPSLGFCFAGGGAQHVAMGAGLHRSENVYRDVVDRCLAIPQLAAVDAADASVDDPCDPRSAHASR